MKTVHSTWNQQPNAYWCMFEERWYVEVHFVFVMIWGWFNTGNYIEYISLSSMLYGIYIALASWHTFYCAAKSRLEGTIKKRFGMSFSYWFEQRIVSDHDLTWSSRSWTLSPTLRGIPATIFPKRYPNRAENGCAVCWMITGRNGWMQKKHWNTNSFRVMHHPLI